MAPNGQLLLTKLHIPPSRSGLVARPHLLARLSDGLSRKLILLSAPAGSGKTTLLSQWVDEIELPVAWLSLDDGDNDLARLLTYVTAALQRISTDIGGDLHARLRATKLPPDEELLTSLVNDLTRVTGDFVLVLDDYHAIEESRIHQAMSFLLDNIPAVAHWVIASRVDPPIPLSRMRGRGELLELRMEDVRFSAEESLEFVQSMVGINLTEGQVKALHARTEGWAAGLQMAAVSLRHHSDPASFIRSFSGDDRYIMDYLMDEVLSRQDAEVRDFLLRSSVLDRFTASMCDAVVFDDQVGGKSRRLIDRLEAANLFLTALDQRRHWYRFHQLFGDLLRQRLQIDDPDLLPVLHARAGAWCWEQSAQGTDHELVSKAIEHALAGGDVQAALQRIEIAAESTFMRSELATFLHWIERIPEKLLGKRPLLSLQVALALAVRGENLRDIEKWMDRSEAADDGTYAGEREAVQGLILGMQGDADHSIEVSRRALENLPADRLFMRSLVADSLGLSYLIRGEIDAAIEALEESARIGEQIGSVITAAGAMSNVAGLLMNAGQLKRSEKLYRRSLQLAVDERGRTLPVGGKALLGLGELAREWNQLDDAESYVRRAIETMELYGDLGSVVGYLSLSRMAQHRGDLEAAQEYLDRSLQLARGTETIEMDDRITMLQQVRLWVDQGNLRAAKAWLQESGLETRPLAGSAEYQQMSDKQYFYVDMAERLTQIRVLLASGEPESALKIVEPYLAFTEKLGQEKRVIEFLILKARAFWSLDQNADALETLEQALAMAEPEGYLRLFLDEGEPLAAMLYKALEAAIAPEYAARILAASEAMLSATPRASVMPGAESLVEPLSDREIEVLALISEGLTNQQIAQKLVLSLSTVKWHTGNIYGKLGAGNRSQAVAIARSFGIL